MKDPKTATAFATLQKFIHKKSTRPYTKGVMWSSGHFAVTDTYTLLIYKPSGISNHDFPEIFDQYTTNTMLDSFACPTGAQAPAIEGIINQSTEPYGCEKDLAELVLSLKATGKHDLDLRLMDEPGMYICPSRSNLPYRLRFNARLLVHYAPLFKLGVRSVETNDDIMRIIFTNDMQLIICALKRK